MTGSPPWAVSTPVVAARPPATSADPLSTPRRAGAHRHLRWALVALVLVTACGGTEPAAVETAPALPAEHPRALPAFGLGDSTPPPVVATTQVADPVRVVVRRLGISAAMDPLELDRKRELRAPEYGRAGWYRDGAEPGEPGRAVIAGHVDSRSGPDVFAPLQQARPGDTVEVELADGGITTFRVDEVDLFSKAAFPTHRVYGGGGVSELRLITCGGTYDRSRGGYQGNVVVFATRVS